MWMLETESGSSTRETSVLNDLAISQVPCPVFLRYTGGPRRTWFPMEVGAILHLPMPNILKPDNIEFYPRRGVNTTLW